MRRTPRSFQKCQSTDIFSVKSDDVSVSPIRKPNDSFFNGKITADFLGMHSELSFEANSNRTDDLYFLNTCSRDFSKNEDSPLPSAFCRVPSVDMDNSINGEINIETLPLINETVESHPLPLSPYRDTPSTFQDSTVSNIIQDVMNVYVLRRLMPYFVDFTQLITDYRKERISLEQKNNSSRSHGLKVGKQLLPSISTQVHFTRLEELLLNPFSFPFNETSCVTSSNSEYTADNANTVKEFHSEMLFQEYVLQYLTITPSSKKFLTLEVFKKALMNVLSKNIALQVNSETIEFFFRHVDTMGTGTISWDQLIEFLFGRIRRQNMIINHSIDIETESFPLLTDSVSTPMQHESITAVAVHPINGIIYTGGSEGDVRMWHADSLRHIRRLLNTGSWIIAICIFEKESRILVLTLGRHLLVLEACTGEVIFLYHGTPFVRGKFSWLYFMSTTRLVDIGSPFFSHKANKKIISNAFSSDSSAKKNIYNVISSKNLKKNQGQMHSNIVPPKKVEELHMIGFSDAPSSMTYSHLQAGTECLFIGTYTGNVLIYHISMLSSELYLRQEFSFAHQGAVRHLQVIEANKNLLTCGDDGVLRYWNLCDGSLIRIFSKNGHSGSVRSFAISLSNKFLVSVASERSGIVWDLINEDPTGVILEPHASFTLCCAVSGGKSALIITVSVDHCIHVYSSTSHRLTQIIQKKIPKSFMEVGIFDKKRLRFIFGTTVPFVHRIRSKTMKRSDTYLGHVASIVGVVISNIFHRVISVDEEGWIISWHATTGLFQFSSNLSNEIFDHSTEVSFTVISLDLSERRLLTGCNSGYFLVWNAANGEVLQIINPFLKKPSKIMSSATLSYERKSDWDCYQHNLFPFPDEIKVTAVAPLKHSGKYYCLFSIGHIIYLSQVVSSPICTEISSFEIKELSGDILSLCSVSRFVIACGTSTSSIVLLHITSTQKNEPIFSYNSHSLSFYTPNIFPGQLSSISCSFPLKTTVSSSFTFFPNNKSMKDGNAVVTPVSSSRFHSLNKSEFFERHEYIDKDISDRFRGNSKVQLIENDYTYDKMPCEFNLIKNKNFSSIVQVLCIPSDTSHLIAIHQDGMLSLWHSSGLILLAVVELSRFTDQPIELITIDDSQTRLAFYCRPNKLYICDMVYGSLDRDQRTMLPLINQSNPIPKDECTTVKHGEDIQETFVDGEKHSSPVTSINNLSTFPEMSSWTTFRHLWHRLTLVISSPLLSGLVFLHVPSNQKTVFDEQNYSGSYRSDKADSLNSPYIHSHNKRPATHFVAHFSDFTMRLYSLVENEDILECFCVFEMESWKRVIKESSCVNSTQELNVSDSQSISKLSKYSHNKFESKKTPNSSESPSTGGTNSHFPGISLLTGSLSKGKIDILPICLSYFDNSSASAIQGSITQLESRFLPFVYSENKSRFSSANEGDSKNFISEEQPYAMSPIGSVSLCCLPLSLDKMENDIHSTRNSYVDSAIHTTTKRVRKYVSNSVCSPEPLHQEVSNPSRDFVSSLSPTPFCCDTGNMGRNPLPCSHVYPDSFLLPNLPTMGRRINQKFARHPSYYTQELRSTDFSEKEDISESNDFKSISFPPIARERGLRLNDEENKSISQSLISPLCLGSQISPRTAEDEMPNKRYKFHSSITSVLTSERTSCSPKVSEVSRLPSYGDPNILEDPGKTFLKYSRDMLSYCFLDKRNGNGKKLSNRHGEWYNLSLHDHALPRISSEVVDFNENPSQERGGLCYQELSKYALKNSSVLNSLNTSRVIIGRTKALAKSSPIQKELEILPVSLLTLRRPTNLRHLHKGSLGNKRFLSLQSRKSSRYDFPSVEPP